MNFLQICQRARMECGLAGSGTPSSVLSQVGVLEKLVDRTQRAWVDIQTSFPYWKFNRNQLVFTLAIDQQEYSVADDFLLTTVDKWDRDSCFIYETDRNDETKMSWRLYRDFRNRYRTFPDGRPNEVSETLNGNVQFNKTPDKAYVITWDYWMTPEKLAANADIPALPEHYHDIIVWKSVMMFAGNETATELYAYAKSQYDPLWAKLVVDQGDVPTKLEAYPLARGDRQSGGTFSEK